MGPDEHRDHRSRLLAQLAEELRDLPAPRPVLVGIDGVDGAGKTCFADALGAALRPSGRQVVRASVDGFHRPRAQRYRQGRDSPRGFYEDSYDYAVLRAALLDPTGPGGSRLVRTIVHDVATDLPVEASAQRIDEDAFLVVDGIFLHRPELRDCWHYSVWLEVPLGVTYARMARRDGCDPDPAAATNRRYVHGQRLYLDSCRPGERASLIVDNTDWARPRVLASRRVRPP